VSGPALHVQRLRPSGRLPVRSSAHASGLDVFADLSARGGELTLAAEPALVPTGIAVEVPPGYEVQVRPRSGLSRQGVVVAFGTVDADYRGELFVNMSAALTSQGSFTLHDGDRIAQLVVAPVVLCDVVEVDELAPSERGAGGFGSTGR
jgi:dUTP pyrophosphatase